MANVFWHNENPTGDEKLFAEKLESLGALTVTNTQGAQLKGPFTLDIQHNKAKGYAIHITPQGTKEPIIFHIESGTLEEADIKGVADYYIERKRPNYTPDPAIDTNDVRDYFCRTLGTEIQNALASRVTDMGSTSHYLASRILDMEISTRMRINDTPSERSRA